MFNDDSVDVALMFGDKVVGVNATAPPLAHRSGEKLLAVFNKNKAVFTKAYRNWTVSGQNNTDNITDFVTSRRSNGTPNEEGKRALMTFFALRCGTPEADVDPLDFTIKLAPEGVAYDDDDAEHCTTDEPRRGGSARKRKKMEDAEAALLKDGNSILKDGMSAVVQSLTARAPVYDDSTAKKAKDVAALTKELSDLYSLLESAQSSGKPSALIARITRSIFTTNVALTKIEEMVAAETN